MIERDIKVCELLNNVYHIGKAMRSYIRALRRKWSDNNAINIGSPHRIEQNLLMGKFFSLWG
jgi:hypothetical protein